MSDGYLSRDRAHLNRLQRDRRKICRRIDYYASPEAVALIELRRSREYPGSARATNGAVLDAIVLEWGWLTGINNQALSVRMSTGIDAGVSGPLRAHANDFGSAPESGQVVENNAEQQLRVQCGAKKYRDGQPCRAMSEPGRKRCKWHGGRSTGPKTAEGRARALANLRQGRQP